MPTFTFTFDELEATVRQLVAENPTYVYFPEREPAPIGYPVVSPSSPSPSCLYRPDERQPGCLFGQALIRLGVKPDEIAEGNPIVGLLLVWGIVHTEKQGNWASYLQWRQDMKVSWRRALADADMKYPLRETAAA